MEKSRNHSENIESLIIDDEDLEELYKFELNDTLKKLSRR
jgi:hypothetical protein